MAHPFSVKVKRLCKVSWRCGCASCLPLRWLIACRVHPRLARLSRVRPMYTIRPEVGGGHERRPWGINQSRRQRVRRRRRGGGGLRSTKCRLLRMHAGMCMLTGGRGTCVVRISPRPRPRPQAKKRTVRNRKKNMNLSFWGAIGGAAARCTCEKSVQFRARHAFVGTRAACSSNGSSRAGVTVVSHACMRRRARTQKNYSRPPECII
jgi:hypothetical protein